MTEVLRSSKRAGGLSNGASLPANVLFQRFQPTGCQMPTLKASRQSRSANKLHRSRHARTKDQSFKRGLPAKCQCLCRQSNSRAPSRGPTSTPWLMKSSTNLRAPSGRSRSALPQAPLGLINCPLPSIQALKSEVTRLETRRWSSWIGLSCHGLRWSRSSQPRLLKRPRSTRGFLSTLKT